MVASHLVDLKAAKSNGLQAIYVEMPLEEDWSDELVENARTRGWLIYGFLQARRDSLL